MHGKTHCYSTSIVFATITSCTKIHLFIRIPLNSKHQISSVYKTPVKSCLPLVHFFVLNTNQTLDSPNILIVSPSGRWIWYRYLIDIAMQIINSMSNAVRLHKVLKMKVLPLTYLRWMFAHLLPPSLVTARYENSKEGIKRSSMQQLSMNE